jgi:hypothetical protein
MAPAPAHLAWDYTTYLNIAALDLIALLYWAYRNREKLGGGSGYALDPVCGMQVEVSTAPSALIHSGHPVYFCSDHCRHRFVSDPAQFTAHAPPASDRHR